MPSEVNEFLNKLAKDEDIGTSQISDKKSGK